MTGAGASKRLARRQRPFSKHSFAGNLAQKPGIILHSEV